VAHGNLRVYFARLFTRDCGQRTFRKIKARSKPRAEHLARQYSNDHGYKFDRIFTRKGFKEEWPAGHAEMWWEEPLRSLIDKGQELDSLEQLKEDEAFFD